MRLSLVATRSSLLKIALACISVISLAVVCYVIVVGLPGSGAGQVSIAYPFEGSTFPPEIIAPTVWWEDGNSKANAWRVTVEFKSGADPVVTSTDTNMWTPDRDTWENIKSESTDRPATITVTSLQNLIVAKRMLSADSVHIVTSPDSVGAPIFYRDVPLPFRFALRNVPMIRWRMGDISSDEPPPVVLTNLPVCGNCHSFSADGKTLGMDVDIGNDKGAYVLTSFDEETVLSREKLISWSDYVEDERVPTFGMLPRVSPDGRYVLAGVKDRTVFLPREDILFSQIFFPVMGILAYYDRETGRMASLRGANDESYVQTNAGWSPDGRYVIFARSRAAELETRNPVKGILLNTEESAEVLGGRQYLHRAQEGAKPFRFDLYRVPFNDGRGGTARPIEGASENGMSNFFPKMSPDGKWMVFTQAHSYMLLQPDSKLYIMPAAGGEPRLMNANTDRMNSWHSWSPNSKWLVFSTKLFGPYTQLFLTHIDEDGNDSPPVWLRTFTASDRAANIPEFVNITPGATRRVVEQFVDDYNYFRSGRVYQQFNEFDRAEEEFSKSLELNPENTFALYSLGTMYAERRDYQDAKKMFERILEIDPDAAIVHKDLGTLYFENEQYDEALREFATAARLDPANVAAHFNLGTMYLMRRRLNDAQREFQLLLRLDIDTTTAVRAHMSLAQIHITRRDNDRIAAEYRAVLALDSTNGEARYNLAVSYHAANNLAAAQREFETLLRMEPDNLEARVELGQVYAQRGALAFAAREFETVLQARPKDVTSLAYLGRVRLELREYDESEKALLDALALDRENLFAHLSLGMLYYEMGRCDEAVPQFRWVVERRPRDANARFMLAEALTREGRSIEEAISAFKAGLALDPNHVQAHVSLGDLYIMQGEYDDALAEFEAALRLRPTDAALRDELAARIGDLRGRTK
jgi:tetratricopeptide (TPR) repeat protein